jgi:hypothetical protein
VHKVAQDQTEKPRDAIPNTLPGGRAREEKEEGGKKEGRGREGGRKREREREGGRARELTSCDTR